MWRLGIKLNFKKEETLKEAIEIEDQVRKAAKDVRALYAWI